MQHGMQQNQNGRYGSQNDTDRNGIRNQHDSQYGRENNDSETGSSHMAGNDRNKQFDHSQNK